MVKQNEIRKTSPYLNTQKTQEEKKEHARTLPLHTACLPEPQLGLVHAYSPNQTLCAQPSSHSMARFLNSTYFSLRCLFFCPVFPFLATALWWSYWNIGYDTIIYRLKPYRTVCSDTLHWTVRAWVFQHKQLPKLFASDVRCPRTHHCCGSHACQNKYWRKYNSTPHPPNRYLVPFFPLQRCFSQLQVKSHC